MSSVNRGSWWQRLFQALQGSDAWSTSPAQGIHPARTDTFEIELPSAMRGISFRAWFEITWRPRGSRPVGWCTAGLRLGVS
jgi:hypothetical protein